VVARANLGAHADAESAASVGAGRPVLGKGPVIRVPPEELCTCYTKMLAGRATS
jgi:hypothetical protein